jgi:lysyl-tRNA synthetase class 2
MLEVRAQLLADIRAFFLRKGVMEVETPICSSSASTDPALESFSTSFTGPGQAQGKQLYLHTSPEFPMKRLLAANAGPIYQICKAFRDGELGRLHNPEFTMLEWYRPGYGQHELMDEVAELINGLLPEPIPVERVSYRELFEQRLGFNPHLANSEQLREQAVRLGVHGAESMNMQSADGWLDLLMSHSVESDLGKGSICFVYDYPASQASLARIRTGDTLLAERFELYMDGIELANGFHELADANEQRSRFESDLERRSKMGIKQVPMDENLLSALGNGIPDCSGVALGIDRLLMRLTGVEHIREVLAFPLDLA